MTTKKKVKQKESAEKWKCDEKKTKRYANDRNVQLKFDFGSARNFCSFFFPPRGSLSSLIALSVGDTMKIML